MWSVVVVDLPPAFSPTRRSSHNKLWARDVQWCWTDLAWPAAPSLVVLPLPAARSPAILYLPYLLFWCRYGDSQDGRPSACSSSKTSSETSKLPSFQALWLSIPAPSPASFWSRPSTPLAACCSLRVPPLQALPTWQVSRWTMEMMICPTVAPFRLYSDRDLEPSWSCWSCFHLHSYSPSLPMCLAHIRLRHPPPLLLPLLSYSPSSQLLSSLPLRQEARQVSPSAPCSPIPPSPGSETSLPFGPCSPPACSVLINVYKPQCRAPHYDTAIAKPFLKCPV